jgi:hypothetical protein
MVFKNKNFTTIGRYDQKKGTIKVLKRVDYYLTFDGFFDGRYGVLEETCWDSY